jgi:hypothetical protein
MTITELKSQLLALSITEKNEIIQFLKQDVSNVEVGNSGSMSESELLSAIQHSVPAAIQSRFSALVAKRHSATLDEVEQRELCDLSDQIEGLDAQRVRHLGQLAQLRSVSIDELMQQLTIIPVDHG